MNEFGVVGREGVFEHAPTEAHARRWAAYTAPVGAVVRPDPAQPATRMPDGTVVIL